MTTIPHVPQTVWHTHGAMHEENYASTYRNTMRDQLPCVVNVLSIDYDGCGDTFDEWGDVKDVEKTHRRGCVQPLSGLPHIPPTSGQTRKQYEFRMRICSVLKQRKPEYVFSGSARIVYQDVFKREQDGKPHVDVLSRAMVYKLKYPSLCHSALRRGDGGVIQYDPYDVPWPNREEILRSKMTIVLQQMLHARPDNGRVNFVFVDDIYARGLAEVLLQDASLVPEWAELHLVEFISPPMYKYRSTRVEHNGNVHFYSGGYS